MTSIVSLVDYYRRLGHSDGDIDSMILRDLSLIQEERIEDYENDPLVQDGWHQQDIIDMYRRER